MVKRSRDESISSSSDTESNSIDITHSLETLPSLQTRSTTDDKYHSPKYTHLGDKSVTTSQQEVMKCHLPPHQSQSFASYEDYEVHYQKFHVNRCLECNKNFPSDHYLGLHIAENHDPLNEARRAKGEKTYGCFVLGCERLCSTPQKRRFHVIDKHQFPRNYDFFIVNDGLDKRNSMLRPTNRRRSSAAAKSAMIERRRSNAVVGNDSTFVTGESTSDQCVVCESTTVDADMNDITKSMSSLRFVPPSVRFGRGRGRGRGGLARR
ncbi:hypothetical protein M501DRAFT_967613 [Patellaria atrata CBS 101060]|uniref:C2H2-type domain-containing protein n=1 Tax=Patellaria atrata CBS 101060 TaxID=1346257 RepID=A0A9P4SJT6_9PEZI|nr:hypothetical protein M501DRAFT_967613 [Patellaria atrata CBS 101060]